MDQSARASVAATSMLLKKKEQVPSLPSSSETQVHSVKPTAGRLAVRRASAVATVDSLGVKKITVNAFKQAISAQMPANAMGASTAAKRTIPFENRIKINDHHSHLGLRRVCELRDRFNPVADRLTAI